MIDALQNKVAERAAFKDVRAVSNSTSKRAAADIRQVQQEMHVPSLALDNLL